MRIVEPDFSRMGRCGVPEVVYGEGKTRKQLVEVALKMMEATGRVIATKVGAEDAEAVVDALKPAKSQYNVEGRVLVAKNQGFRVKEAGKVGVITAGTSDVGVAEEARVILEELGCRVTAAYDVGVAGIHRLYPALRRMTDVGAVIVVAGMEGALPSVVSGLVDVPVIGVPSSVGYGVGSGGKAALNAMLSSCTPVAVVNIDNGYGAAVIAYQIVRR